MKQVFSMRYLSCFLLAVFLFCVSCSGTGHKEASVSPDAGNATIKANTKVPLKGIGKKENSYYYFLVSELFNAPESLDQSEALLDMALKKNGASAFLLSQKAIDVARRSDWKKALQFAKQSYNKDSNNPDTLLLLGKLHAAQKEPDKAIAFYLRALELNRRTEETYNLLAREQLSLGAEAGAISSLNACLKELPEAMSCMYYLATIYYEKGNYNQALRYFDMISAFDPENPKLLQTVGEIYLKKKDYARALGVFEQLKKLGPGDPTFSIRVGLIYYELKRIDDAIAEFLDVAQRFPKADRINYFLGLLYMEKRQNQDALKYLDQVTADSPLFREAVSRMLHIFRLNRDVRGALEVLERKFDKTQDAPDILGLKASLYVHLGNYKKALGCVNEAMARYGAQEDLLLQHAIVLDKLNRWSEARVDLEKIVRQNPKADVALNYLGYTLLERGKPEEAESYISQAAALKPADGHVTDSVGWLAFKRGDYQKALQVLLKANAQSPNEPAILDHLGDAFLANKNPDQARNHYEKALLILINNAERTAEDEVLLKSVKEKLSAVSGQPSAKNGLAES